MGSRFFTKGIGRVPELYSGLPSDAYSMGIIDHKCNFRFEKFDKEKSFKTNSNILSYFTCL